MMSALDEPTPAQRSAYKAALLADGARNPINGEHTGDALSLAGAIHTLGTSFLMFSTGNKIPAYVDEERLKLVPEETKNIFFTKPSHLKNVENYLGEDSPEQRQFGLKRCRKEIAVPLLIQVYHLLNPNHKVGQLHRLAIEQVFRIFDFGKIPEFSTELYSQPAATQAENVQLEIDKLQETAEMRRR